MRQVCGLFKLISALLITVTLSVGLLGLSYSFFTGADRISSRVSMGDMDVVFSSLYIVADEGAGSSCTAGARIVNNGKDMEINIDNAEPGYSCVICYEVTNNGSVPVSFKLTAPGSCSDMPVKLTFSEGIDYIKRNGGKARGHIVISVGEDSGGCGSCSAYTELNFQQAIVEVG